MKIFVLRHGFAGDNRQPKGEPDPDLPLTVEGRDAIKNLVTWMRENDAAPKRIYASPLRRTQQTAQIIREAFSLPKVRSEDGLGPDKPLQMVVKKLTSKDDEKRVLLISHHDSIAEGLRALNFLDEQQLDPIACGELRCLTVDRDTGNWEEDARVLPSDLGGVDMY